MPDAVVLNYHDSILRVSDIELLNGPHWLNDSLIGFYLEYLQHDVFSNSEHLLFISPEVTQCLKGSSKQDLPIFLEPLQADTKEFIFLPLNDCEITDRPGGSHWSLLVYSRPEQTVYHFDSAGSNVRQARRLVSNIAFALSLDGCDYEEFECLQQENCYDCGVFVLCHAEATAANAIEKGGIRSFGVLDPRTVAFHRKNMLDVIHRLMQTSKKSETDL